MSVTFDPRENSEGILAALLEASDAAIVTTDLEGTILTWNAGAVRLYGYAAREVLGRPVAVLLPQEPADLMTAHFARIKAGDRVEGIETTRRAKDGQSIAVSLTLSPIRDRAGAVIGAISMARDLRGQKRVGAALDASEARWRAVIESAVDGIILIDAQGRIEVFNPGAERLFGYSEGELLGQNVSVLMPSPYREEHDSYIQRYLHEGRARVIGIGREVSARRKDGTLFPVHLSVGEVSVGGERRFTGILHDLTPRVQMEHRLREQASMARLGEMAAVIAHEVKNPLAGIRGAVQVIGSRLHAASMEAEVAKEIVARIDALNELMKDLLMFARPPQPKAAAVDVVPLAISTAELMRADPAMRDVTVTVTGSAPPVIADAGLLKIVFTNVFVNSAHAMKGRGTIRVHVEGAAASCTIVVSDEGPGIPPEVRERVFEPFFTTKSRGTGLGLPTARRVIEAHRGRLTLDCPPHGGTVVTIELPLHG